jgi:hypothetical protein
MSKKFLIPFSDLPYTKSDDPQHYVRYRIVSEDKNRVSAWTNIFTVNANISYQSSSTIQLTRSSNVLSVVWNYVLLKKTVRDITYSVGQLKEYDLWIRWSNNSFDNPNLGNWLYFGRVTGTSTILNIPASVDHLSIEIYRPTNSPSRASTQNFLLYSSYDQTSWTVDLSTVADGGNAYS